MPLSDYREMNKIDETEEKQNESLPPNISWPDVLEGKLTPSEDTTGKWVASTTSFERKGLRFGMESSPASAEVKGSMQAEEREDRETEKSGEEEVGIRVRQQPEKESMQNRSPKSREHRCWLEVLEEPAALYLPTLLPLEALWSLAAWRAGKLTAGRKGHSPSLPHWRWKKYMRCFYPDTGTPFLVHNKEKQTQNTVPVQCLIEKLWNGGYTVDLSSTH